MSSSKNASDIVLRNKNRAEYASYLENKTRIEEGRLLNINPPPSSEYIRTVNQGITTLNVEEFFTVKEQNIIPGKTLTTLIVSEVGARGWTAPAKTYSVEYLVVGGGGGSGGGYNGAGGGGGGGGQVITGRLDVFPGYGYTIVVGDGGDGGVSIREQPPDIPLASETNGTNGQDSVFASIRAFGGGGGFASRRYVVINGTNVSGLGGIPPSSTTGSRGGSGGAGGGGGGGGGGAGGSGTSKSGATPGVGGVGISSDLSGTITTYGAGGNGAAGSTLTTAVAGDANTGNGAKAGGTGSSNQTNGAKGGSGIVILRYYQ